MTIIVGAGVVTLIAGMVALLLRRRRRARLNLRLLAGRRRLLTDQIEERSEALSEIDDEQIARQTQLAKQALDELNVLLIERQSHLLNFEDLTNLQSYRICVLEAALRDAAAPESTDATTETEPHIGAAASRANEVDAGAVERGPLRTTAATQRGDDAPTRSEEPPPKRDRAGLEQQVLDRISQLNRARRNRKK